MQKQRKQQLYAEALSQQMQAKSPPMKIEPPTITPPRDTTQNIDHDTDAEIERLRGMRMALEAQNREREQRIR